MQYRRFLFLIFLFFGNHFGLFGQVIENYDYKVILEEDSGWPRAPHLVKVTINTMDFPLADLMITVPRQSSVFIDGVLWLFAQEDTSFVAPLWELNEQFLSGDIKEFVVFKPGIQKEEVSIKKGVFSGTVAPVLAQGKEEAFMLSLRQTDDTRDFFLVSFLVTLFFIALFKLAYPSVLFFMLHPVSLFSKEDIMESASMTKLFTAEILFFLLIFNMLLMWFILFSVRYLDFFGLASYLTGDPQNLYLIWLLGTAVLMFLSLIKFLWLKISASVFEINRFEFPHFLFVLRILSIILIITYVSLILALANGVFSVTFLIPLLWKIFFAIYFLGLCFFYFIITKKTSFKDYHLFSYLCTSELVPYLVISKLIIG